MGGFILWGGPSSLWVGWVVFGLDVRGISVGGKQSPISDLSGFKIVEGPNLGGFLPAGAPEFRIGDPALYIVAVLGGG